MTRISSVRVVAWTSYVFASVIAGSSALATDLVVDSSVLFSALDGSASDEDTLADGLLTISSLTITGSGEIILDVPTAEFHVLGDVRLAGHGAIRPPQALPPVVGPTLTILSGQSILMLGTSAIVADGTEAGGAVLLCAAEEIDLRGRTATIASSGLGPNGVGGSIVLQGGARIKLNSSAARIMANGAVGGNVTLISCGEDVVDDEENEDEVAAGLAILIKGQIQAVGSDGSGGGVEISSRQGGIEFRGNPGSLAVDAGGSTDDGTIALTAATTVTPNPPPTNPPAAVTTDSPSGETCNCSFFGPLLVTIQSPENRSVTADSLVDVTGRVSGAALVTVNGVVASVFAGTFVALDVALAEGTNVLVATAENEVGDTASDTVSVRRDTTPPLVVIETPRGGDRLVTETVTVAGTVNDIIPGATTNADDVTVTVNNLPAAVNNRTFILPDLPLELGPNTIVATAVDRVGNTKTTTIQVTREPDLAGIQIVITGGNPQSGPINSLLPVPLSVRLQDADGFAFPNRPVTFEVSRGDGRLDDPLDNLRLITLLTDGDGNAAVDFTLGSRTGEGFHRVRTTTPGSLTFAEFCATAEPAAPVNIAINAMPPSQGIAGQTLPTPLSVIVTDEGGNPAPDVAVTFDVEFGGGNFGGADNVQASTNADGVAEAEWTLGPNPGVAINEATATFDGNPGFPATFIVSGIVTGAVEDTTVSAIVQDSTGRPIEGAQAVLRNTALEAFTGPDGKFTITGVPPGGHHVGILGSAADDPENGIFFPDIDFAIEAISGVDNMLDPPVVILPFLDIAGAQLVGGDEDVILTMADTAGFSVKVFAHSTFTRDPVTNELVQDPLVMSSSQVKFDKMPMPPPQGSTPLVVGTLQPPGVIFDPPARVTYPNVGGLAPGDVADMFAFHHDIGQFVNIGPGTVSEDGSVVVSDPGFGIVQSGWHCLIRIPGPAANCANKCRAVLQWRIVKADGTLGPVKTTGPVVLSCTDGDAKKAEIKVLFAPGGGSFDSQNWSAGSALVTLTGQSASGTSAEVTVEAGTQTGTTTVTSPIYRIPVQDQADKTCQAEIGVAVGGVEFLDAPMNKTSFANVANWETAFDAGPSARQNFHETDADRFFAQITDPARKGTGGATATITATMRTIDSASATADTVENFTLTETTSGSGVFKSGPCVLVSNRVDDQFQANGVADGNAADPTFSIFVPGKMTSAPLSIQVGGTVRVDYNASTGMGPTGGADGECHAQIDVCKAETIKTVILRPFILRTTVGGTAVTTDTKVTEDFALMNVAWAQCCIRLVGGSNIQTVDPPPAESFMDVGFDHDSDPNTPNINPTAGFDFVDNNANNLHDAGEPAEPFTDTNGNGGYDFGVNLADGSLDEFTANLFPTREERSLIDSLADSDADTIEYFVVNALSSGSFGEAFIPSVMQQANNLLFTNVAIFPSSTPGNRFITSAHEVGHVLLNNGGHTDRTTTAGRVNVMVGGGTDAADGVNNSKRLTNAQCTTARGF